MMNCSHCHVQLAENALFCWHCGRPQQHEPGLTVPSLVLAETAAEHTALTPSADRPQRSINLSSLLVNDAPPRSPSFHASATSWGVNAGQQASFHASPTVMDVPPVIQQFPLGTAGKQRPLFEFYTRTTPVPILHAALFLLTGILIGTLLSWSIFAYSYKSDLRVRPNTSTFHPTATSSPTLSVPANVPTQSSLPSPTPSLAATPLPPMAYEAESSANTLEHSATVMPCVTCSGGAKVSFVGMGGVLQINNVLVSTAGSYILTLFYGTTEPRTVFISINANSPLPMNCASTGGFDTIGSQSVMVTLIAGNNTLAFFNESAWAPDIDKIVVSPAS